MMRGVPRLSSKQIVVLELLVEHGPLYGLQLVDLSGGALGRGTVYVTLGRMQAKDYVVSREVVTPAGEQGPARRVYRAASVGRRALRAHRAAVLAWNDG